MCVNSFFFFFLKHAPSVFLPSLQSCSECPEPTLAQSLCTLCNKWLCYQCTDVHQHHRAPATAQYADVHPQQRPSAAQHPDQHQKGSSALPVTGQGKMFTCLRGRLPLCCHLCGMLILELPCHTLFLCHLKVCFDFFISLPVLCLLVSHVSVGSITMNNTWRWRWLIRVPGDPCALLHLSLTCGPDSEVLV